MSHIAQQSFWGALHDKDGIVSNAHYTAEDGKHAEVTHFLRMSISGNGLNESMTTG